MEGRLGWRAKFDELVRSPNITKRREGIKKI
jgi:hypothetical protein